MKNSPLNVPFRSDAVYRGIEKKWPRKSGFPQTTQCGSIQLRKPFIRLGNYPAFGRITNQGFLPFVTKSPHCCEQSKIKQLNALHNNDPGVNEHAGTLVLRFCLRSV
jgi:hypothetical protein